ncbi:MAG: hypothetical protein OEV79_03065 [candidate division WOR-3 bacterium]|nr:hypothetical protein [candidate division WOR-3 bacterium]
MKELFKDIEIADPVFLRNLLIHPISGSSGNGIEIASLEDILRTAKGEFGELDPPDINRISFFNHGDAPLLMLDGEEIIGSLQNRIVADSTLVTARATSEIPVICAEEGRWEDIGSFQTGYCSYPTIRAILSRRGKEGNGLQKKIWNEIERKLTVTRTLSTTSSMHDIYNNLEDEVTRYLEDFESLAPETIGFVGVAGRKILGCDMFLNYATYRKFERKLARSYALDAIEHRKTSGGQVDTHAFLDDIFNSVNKKTFSKDTHHFSLRDKRVAGQGFFSDGHVIHLSVFPR